MKRTSALLIALMLSVSLTACGGNCKADGCDEQATNGDYCSYHATKNNVEQAAKDVFNFFTGG